MSRLTMSDAIVAAVAAEMAVDPSIYLMGQDIGVFGGPMNSSQGLWERFGAQDALYDSPISEAAMVGTAVGAAMAGARPIVDLMFGEFVNLTLTSLGLEGSSVAFRTAGRMSVPLVIRAKYGIGPHRGHPETPVGALLNYPGLKIVAPTTPQDAFSLTTTAIRDENPVVILDHMSLLHAGRAGVDPAVTVPIGKADVVADGEDITLVGTGLMVKRAQRARKKLAAAGISAEVIDLRTIKPLDTATVAASAMRTGSVLLIEESWPSGGPMTELCAQLVKDPEFSRSRISLNLLAPPDTPIPYGTELEKLYTPGVDTIVEAATSMIRTETLV